jgi:hypothetical protein
MNRPKMIEETSALLDEAYKSFLLGLYFSTVSLCSIMTERLCYDILEKSRIKINNKKLSDGQKKALFKIPYSTLVELIESTTLINRQVASDLMKMNNIREIYSSNIGRRPI